MRARPKKAAGSIFCWGHCQTSGIHQLYLFSQPVFVKSISFFLIFVFFHKEKGKVTKLYSLNSINFRTSYGIVQSYFCLHPAFLPHPQRFLWYKISFCLVKSTPHFQYKPQLASYAKGLKVLYFFRTSPTQRCPRQSSQGATTLNQPVPWEILPALEIIGTPPSS